jgi:ferredoxin
MLAFAFSVLIQKKLGYSRWRSLHTLAHAAYVLLTAHLLISGRHVLPVPAVWIPVVVSQVIVIALWLITASQVSGKPRAMGERVGARLRAQQATVNVDPGRCVRFGFCEHEAPEVFQLRSDGRLAYQPQVTSDNLDAVIQAARVCPARAIMLTRQATTVVMANQEEGGGDDKTAAPRGDDRPRVVRSEDEPRAARTEDRPRAVRTAEDGPRGSREDDRPRAIRGDSRPRAIRGDDRPRIVRGDDRPRVLRGDEGQGPRPARGDDDRPRGVPNQRPTRLDRRGGSRHGGGA